MMSRILKFSLLLRGTTSRYCSTSSNGAMTKSAAQAILRKADAVCFDVDSTVIDEEGIDVLASYTGSGEAVAEWTKKYSTFN